MVKLMIVYLFFLLGGCVTTRPYPLCYCDEKPSAEQYTKIEKDITEILHQYTSINNPVAFSTDHRWAFLKATRHQNKKIERIWPRIACIGKKNDSDQLETNKRCIEYIMTMLKNKKYNITEDKRTGYLFCGGEPF